MQQQSKNIRALVLDFGGVIYEISHQIQKETFARLGIGNFDELYSQARQSPLFADFERGRVTNDEFREAVRSFIGDRVGREEIEEAWNSILVGFPEENVRFLEALKNHYDLYLLSNTNAIHYDVYTEEFIRKFGYDFNSLFRKTFWSFRVGMRKPDAEIYRHVISESGGDKASMLFIDDTEANVAASVKSGLPALWLRPGQTLRDLFDENLALKF